MAHGVFRNPNGPPGQPFETSGTCRLGSRRSCIRPSRRHVCLASSGCAADFDTWHGPLLPPAADAWPEGAWHTLNFLRPPDSSPEPQAPATRVAPFQPASASSNQHQHQHQQAANDRHAVISTTVLQAPAPDPAAKEAWALLERRPLAGGWLELVRWEAAPSQRLLRVWVPPGYYTQRGKQLIRNLPPAGGWPVFYMHDGQNLFDDKLAFSGHSWRAAHAAQQVIREGSVPPFVIVGMDHAGAQRSYEYTPYKPGIGPGGYRSDAAQWPGGGVWQYLERVTQEVMPWAQRAYEVSTAADRVAVGGSSFGGIATLCMGMRYPHLFQSAMVESPSLWIHEAQFLNRDIKGHKGPWPRHMFLAMGDSEYKGDGTLKFSRMLVGYLHTLAETLHSQGVHDGLCSQIGVEHTHSEAAWAERLPGALRHLCSHWAGANAMSRSSAASSDAEDFTQGVSSSSSIRRGARDSKSGWARLWLGQ